MDRWRARGVGHGALGISDLFCPFPASKLNPGVLEVQRASVEWADTFGLVRSANGRAKLDEARIAWVVGRAFPSASRDVLQLATDWTTLFCLLDDGIELRRADPIDLAAYFLRLHSAFKGEKVKDLEPIGRALVDLRERMLRVSSERCTARFADTFKELLGGFLWEEINRWKRIRPAREAYRTMRQITVGLRPQFLLGEIAIGIELSDRARNHRDIGRLESITCSVIGCANDIFTCAKEMETDTTHNAVLLAMEEESLSLMEVLLHLKRHHDELVREFQTTAERLPDFRSEAPSVKGYVDMLRACIRGHLDWARETGRYAR